MAPRVITCVMKLLTCALILVWALPTFATSIYENVREGKSFYLDSQFDSKIVQEKSDDVTGEKTETLSKLISKDELVALLSPLFEPTEKANRCSTDLVAKIDETLKESGFEKFESYSFEILRILREANLFDDVVMEILLNASSLHYRGSLPTFKKVTKEEAEALKRTFVVSAKKLEQGQCLTDIFKSMVGEFRKLDKDLKSSKIKAFHKHALKNDLISKDLYEALEMARLGQVHEWRLTLNEYREKMRMIRLQYPLEQAEYSDFVTERSQLKKVSMRRRLLESYSPYQIFLMGDLVKKLRERLEASKVEIQLFNEEGEITESVPLSPMEQFRFILKLLRKEMDALKHHAKFEGRPIQYGDLIVAAYEIGLVPEVEVAEVASLEEIWNPERTGWEKASIWINTFGSVATVVIPAPFNYVSILALIAIEMVTPKSEGLTDKDYNLF